jgi:thioredoxin 1
MPITLTKDNWEAEVNQSNIPVLVDFWAVWCHPCHMMEPLFDELSVEYEGKIKFGKLNTEESPQYPQSFQVMGIPTLIMIKDGKEIGRIVGFNPKDRLKAKIEEILKKI